MRGRGRWRCGRSRGCRRGWAGEAVELVGDEAEGFAAAVVGNGKVILSVDELHGEGGYTVGRMHKADTDVVLSGFHGDGGYLMQWLRVAGAAVDIDNKRLAMVGIEVEVYVLVMMLSASGG